MAGALTLAAYAHQRRLRDARRHLLALAAVGAAVMAWRWRLDAFALVLPHPGSVVPGGSYTDVHARLPILRAFTLLALAAAGLCAYVAVRPVRPRRLVVPVGAVARARGRHHRAAGADRALRRRAAGAGSRAPLRRPGDRSDPARVRTRRRRRARGPTAVSSPGARSPSIATPSRMSRCGTPACCARR